MNWEAIHTLAEIFFGLISIVSMLVAWQTRKTHAQKSAVEAVEKKLMGLMDKKHDENLGNFKEIFGELRLIGRTVGQLESSVANQPTTRDIDVIRQTQSAGSNVTSELKASVEALTRTVDRISDFLMGMPEKR